ncbi:MAG: YHS domain-containing protein [Alphaproteobacteria bacterium]|nr:YHS domain-containing protein [Alphaproteobacteria bacterium SS10]
MTINVSNSSRRQFFALGAAAVGTAVVLGSPLKAEARDPVYTGTFSSNAVSGYDTVAYFTEGKPVEGSSEFQTEWNGATWKFSSAENLAKFEADPERYAPQYGGYCAWAMAKGQFASTQPENWAIVDGKLYLNYNDAIQARWDADIPNFISQADTQWGKKGL